MKNKNLWSGVAAGATTGILGMIGQRARENRSLKNQRELMDLQMKNQMTLNKQGNNLQYEMWKKTNYPAQMEMLREAGLNPSLIYGMSGGGGATTGGQGGGSASGGNAPQPQQMDIASYLQSAMMASEIELKKSQAEKNKTEVEKIKGIDTKEAESRIANLTQGIENSKAVEMLTKAQTYLTKIEGYVKNESKEDMIDGIIYNAQKAMKEVEMIEYETEISKNTVKEKINIIKQESINAILENAMKREGIKKTKEETQAISTGILQKWQEIRQGQQKIDIDKFKEEVKANFPTLQQIGGRALDQMLEGIHEITGGRSWEPRKIKK